MTTQLFQILPAALDISIHDFFVTIFANHTNIVFILSILADIFVFVYPFWLIYMYLIGHINHKPNYKKLSLQATVAVVLCFIVNMTIQHFIWKSRPDQLNGIALILKHVPDNSFPSDHMAVGLAFALVVLISKYIYDADFLSSKTIKKMGYAFLAIAFTMGFCRVAIGIHRFTDICAGIVVGSLSGYLVYALDSYLDRYIYQYIIGLQNWLFDKLYIDKLLGLKK